MGSIWSPGISHLGVGIGSIQYLLVGREVNSFPSVQLSLTCKQSAYRLYSQPEITTVARGQRAQGLGRQVDKSHVPATAGTSGHTTPILPVHY